MSDMSSLHMKVQRWVYDQGWPSLRPIQQKAIDPILRGDTDVLISASTAAGKTEAAFLPALSAVADEPHNMSFRIMYISPLKALINDQYRRLEPLCERLEMPVTRWHGDASQSLKSHVRKRPDGVLLITPESLEAMLINHNGWSKSAFAFLSYIVIDEFHAFIGTDRGQQLLSLLARLEHVTGRLGRPIPRIALSATLGNLESVPASLRSTQSLPCTILTDATNRSVLQLEVRGYVDEVISSDEMTDEVDESKESEQYQQGIIGPEDKNPRRAIEKIASDLFTLCRGGSHLVFANSRGLTEELSASLSDRCERRALPNEFFPHHGSLDKGLREALEARMQKDNLPTTAVCTMTFELGIDIGKVDSVFQIRPPHSVASLRQRQGRSGRRGGPSVLRLMIPEQSLRTSSDHPERLRLNLVQSLAITRLLVRDRWFEPADTQLLHFSTLLHQVLALIGQWGAIQPADVHALLCTHGPFTNVSVDQFKLLLSDMGKRQLIHQLGSGELVVGIEGERIMNRHTFFSVFHTPPEYRVIFEGKPIGTIPIESMPMENEMIIFGGKRWRITQVDGERLMIRVVRATRGKAPPFMGGRMGVHDRVREEMHRIYSEAEYRIEAGGQLVDYIDDTAKVLFKEGADYYHERGLATQSIIDNGAGCSLFPWRGDKITLTLSTLLSQRGLSASSEDGIITVDNGSVEQVRATLRGLLESESVPRDVDLARLAPVKTLDKYDELLPENLLDEGFAKRSFDVAGAMEWIRNNIGNQKK